MKIRWRRFGFIYAAQKSGEVSKTTSQLQDCFALELFPMLTRLIGMKKKLKWIFLVLVVLFGLLQLTNPARTNPPVVYDLPATNAPPHVAALLHAACYDCHSYETKWPWYSRIAPMSWLITQDVNEGRTHLNFSDWPKETDRAAKKLDRINEVIDYREMPPKKYTALHPDARLTEAQHQELLDWSETQSKIIGAVTPQP
jgi:hypothetical protein